MLLLDICQALFLIYVIVDKELVIAYLYSIICRF
jgi:hypothetical protein